MFAAVLTTSLNQWIRLPAHWWQKGDASKGNLFLLCQMKILVAQTDQRPVIQQVLCEILQSEQVYENE